MWIPGLKFLLLVLLVRRTAPLDTTSTSTTTITSNEDTTVNAVITAGNTADKTPTAELPRPIQAGRLLQQQQEDDGNEDEEVGDEKEDQKQHQHRSAKRARHRIALRGTSARPTLMDIALEASAREGLQAMAEVYGRLERDIVQNGRFLQSNHPAALLSRFSAPADGDAHSEMAAYAAITATKAFRRNFKQYNDLARHSHSQKISLRRTALEGLCPPRDAPVCMPASERYRTHDGTCNNKRHPRWGSAQMPFNRFLPPEYGDGVDSVRESSEGGALSSSRFVSLLVHGAKDGDAPITLMTAQWGQLLDHDLTSTAQPRAINGSVPSCCGRQDFHPSCFPIKVPLDDPWLAPLKVRCLEFLRSAPAQRRDCVLSWREQTNQATSYIDASPIYANNAKASDNARIFRSGLLVFGRGNPAEDVCQHGAIATHCIRAGDGRSGEQPGLLALHHVWVGEHNRIAVELSEMNPHWSDEKLYQEARRIVGAMFQHITYREFLPVILGREVCKLFDLELLTSGYYLGHNPKVNPTVANSFAAAAFRFGHSLVQNSYLRCDRHHNILNNNVSLHEEFQRGDIGSAGSLHRLLRGLATQRALKRDEFITPELTNHLFQTPGFPFGLDLAAINIQRGRDHGIAPYTTWRVPCGLSAINGWDDLANVVGPESAQRIAHAYRSVHDIDLFVGGIAERPVMGGLVGPTFACIIAQQFSNSRKGDRFWYENGELENSFTPAQLHTLRRVTLAQVLCRSVGGGTFQPHIFIPAEQAGNQRQPCGSGSLTPIDLGPWLELDPFAEPSPQNQAATTFEEISSEPERVFNIMQPVQIQNDAGGFISSSTIAPAVIKENSQGFPQRTNPPLPPLPSISPHINFVPNSASGFQRRPTVAGAGPLKISDKLDLKRKSSSSTKRPGRPHSSTTTTSRPISGINNKLDKDNRINVRGGNRHRPSVSTTTRRTVVLNNLPLELRTAGPDGTNVTTVTNTTIMPTPMPITTNITTDTATTATVTTTAKTVPDKTRTVVTATKKKNKNKNKKKQAAAAAAQLKSGDDNLVERAEARTEADEDSVDREDENVGPFEVTQTSTTQQHNITENKMTVTGINATETTEFTTIPTLSIDPQNIGTETSNKNTTAIISIDSKLDLPVDTIETTTITTPKNSTTTNDNAKQLDPLTHDDSQDHIRVQRHQQEYSDMTVSPQEASNRQIKTTTKTRSSTRPAGLPATLRKATAAATEARTSNIQTEMALKLCITNNATNNNKKHTKTDSNNVAKSAPRIHPTAPPTTAQSSTTFKVPKQPKTTAKRGVELRQYQTRPIYTRPSNAQAHKVIVDGPNADQYEIEINIRQTNKSPAPQVAYRPSTTTYTYDNNNHNNNKYPSQPGGGNNYVDYINTTPARPYYPSPTTKPPTFVTHNRRTKPPTIIYLNEHDERGTTTRAPNLFQNFITFATNGFTPGHRPHQPEPEFIDSSNNPGGNILGNQHSAGQPSLPLPLPIGGSSFSQVGSYPVTVHATSGTVSTGAYGSIVGVATSNGADSTFSFNIRPRPERPTHVLPPATGLEGPGSYGLIQPPRNPFDNSYAHQHQQQTSTTSTYDYGNLPSSLYATTTHGQHHNEYHRPDQTINSPFSITVNGRPQTSSFYGRTKNAGVLPEEQPTTPDELITPSINRLVADLTSITDPLDYDYQSRTLEVPSTSTGKNSSTVDRIDDDFEDDDDDDDDYYANDADDDNDDKGNDTSATEHGNSFGDVTGIDQRLTQAKRYNKDGYLRPQHMLEHLFTAGRTAILINDTYSNATVIPILDDNYVLPVLTNSNDTALEFHLSLPLEPTTDFMHDQLNNQTMDSDYLDTFAKNFNNDILAEDYTDETTEPMLTSKTVDAIDGVAAKEIMETDTISVEEAMKQTAFAPLQILTKPERPDNWVIYDTPQDDGIPLLPELPAVSGDTQMHTVEIPTPMRGSLNGWLSKYANRVLSPLTNNATNSE